MWRSAAGGRYPDLLILCDVLNWLRPGLGRVTWTVGNIFYLLIESFSNNHQSSMLYLNTFFYIGKQEALASGYVSTSDIKQFKKHLTQTGHNLKGLYLQPWKASSLPGKYVLSLRLPSFSHAFLRNRAPQEPLPSITAVRLASQQRRNQKVA